MARPSNKQLNRYGDTLRKNVISHPDYQSAVNNISEWRALHEGPLQSLNSSLRKKLSKLTKSAEYRLDGNHIVSRRLKRMPSIEAKLKRFDDMQLSRVEDIGGLRVILKDMRHIRVFLDDLKYYESKSKSFVITRERNYINPTKKGEIKQDGYKSFHQVYKCIANNKHHGLKLELQIRTYLQHAWATAVETLGIIQKTPYKSGKGEEDYKEFFRLVSIAFSHIENTHILQEYQHFSLQEICIKIYELNKKLKIIEYLRSFSVTHGRFNTKKHYYVMRLDIDKSLVNIVSYDKNDFHSARDLYKQYELEVEQNNKNWEVVLISINDIKKLRTAYPNYFLDAKKFTNKLESLLQNYCNY